MTGIINEQWYQNDDLGTRGGAGKRWNFHTSTPTPSQACERIAAALGGTLMLRTTDLTTADLEEMRLTGKLPEKTAVSVDVTDFYTKVSTNEDGSLKKPGAGRYASLETLFEVETERDLRTAAAEKAAARKALAEKEPEVGTKLLVKLWGFTLKSTGIWASAVGKDVKVRVEEKLRRNLG